MVKIINVARLDEAHDASKGFSWLGLYLQW